MTPIKQMFNKKNKKNLLVLAMLFLILFFSYTYTTRFKIYASLGTLSFGGKILNQDIYNLALAEFFFMKANQQDKPDLWINYQLSRINFIKGKFPAALVFANKELSLYPQNCRAHYIRGLIYGYTEEIDNAIHDFEIFNTCSPNTWAGNNDLAWLWFRKGDMQKVIEITRSALSKGTNGASPWLQNTYGVALMNTGNYKEAREAFLVAKYLADNMNEKQWGVAYPGNHPNVYKKGLSAMRLNIDKNIELLEKLEVIHKKK